MHDRLEAFQVRSACRARGHVGAGFDRRAANGLAQNFVRLLLADRLAHLVVDRRDDRGLDLSARKNAEFAVLVIIHGLQACAEAGSMSNSRRRPNASEEETREEGLLVGGC